MITALMNSLRVTTWFAREFLPIDATFCITLNTFLQNSGTQSDLDMEAPSILQHS